MLSLWNDFGRIGMPSLLGWAPSRVLDQVTSPVRVQHEEDHVVVTADMPGVDPKDLDLTFEGGALSVVGRRGESSYQFTVQLGNQFDGDKIEASLDKGVLTIKAEMRPESKPRRIPLKGIDSKTLESGESH
jgi:HSP20 family protein